MTHDAFFADLDRELADQDRQIAACVDALRACDPELVLRVDLDAFGPPAAPVPVHPGVPAFALRA